MTGSDDSAIEMSSGAVAAEFTTKVPEPIQIAIVELIERCKE